MFRLVFLGPCFCVALARNEDEPEKQAETEEGKESLESHYGAGHFVFFTALVLCGVLSYRVDPEILVTLAASAGMVVVVVVGLNCCHCGYVMRILVTFYGRTAN